MTGMAILATLQKKEKQMPQSPLTTDGEYYCAAYNEEVNACRTVASLLQQDYPNLQVVFVDDGMDDTFQKVKEALMIIPCKKYIPNQTGEASALNFGVHIPTAIL